jgi:hypothetical protein
MEIDSAILASEVKMPRGVTLAGPEEGRVAWIQPPRVTAEEDLVPVDAREAGLEGEEGVEGEDREEAVEGSGDGGSAE